jgi:hypothetical protein
MSPLRRSEYGAKNIELILVVLVDSVAVSGKLWKSVMQRAHLLRCLPCLIEWIMLHVGEPEVPLVLAAELA